jgi:hypothetical protein
MPPSLIVVFLIGLAIASAQTPAVQTRQREHEAMRRAALSEPFKIYWVANTGSSSSDQHPPTAVNENGEMKEPKLLIAEIETL